MSTEYTIILQLHRILSLPYNFNPLQYFIVWGNTRNKSLFLFIVLKSLAVHEKENEATVQLDSCKTFAEHHLEGFPEPNYTDPQYPLVIDVGV